MMNWQIIFFVICATVLLVVVARLVNQLIMNVHLIDSLVEKDNPAIGVQSAGYLLAIMLITASVLSGEGQGSIIGDVIPVIGYGIGSIIILALISTLSLRFMLSKHCMQYVREGNVAAGIVVAGSYVGTGVIIASCVSGDDHGGTFVTSLVFFVVGQISLLVITSLFRLLTAYDDKKEILDGNIPAALSYAGIMIAVGIIISHAVEGDFAGYQKSLIAFAKAIAAVTALYPIRQILVQGLLLGGGFTIYGGRLDTEISEDRNLNAGIIEAVSYISAALMIARLS
jgi:uncharacterized membrane protein YjfL (UPF0719 family)